MYAKVSKKGQVTIPKAVRDMLNIGEQGGVLFIVSGNDVKIRGVTGSSAEKLAGSLKKYAKSYIPPEKARGDMQKKAAEDIAKEGLIDSRS